MLTTSIDQFHVAQGETCIGRHHIDEILSRVERGELDPFDHVYDEDRNDWIAIIVHPTFAARQEFWNSFKNKSTRKSSPSSSPNSSNSSNANVIHLPGARSSKSVAAPELEDGKEAWFVLKGDHRFGPFEYLELVRLTQEKNLSDWDYVWTKRFPKWVRISSLKEFQPQTIESLRDSLSHELGGEVNEVFFRRRFARAPFQGSILVHNNQKLFRGKSIEMGAGGLSLALAEGDIKVGDKLHLHVKPSRETPAFNSACEVMTRRVLNAGDAKSPVVYGLKFLEIETGVKSEIDSWATRTIGKNGNSEAA